MSLIQCPECNKEISDKAKWCVHCGYPLQSQDKDTIAGIPKLLTLQDIRRIFGCSATVVNSLIKTEGFPTLYIGKECYVPREEFQQWIKENIGKTIQIK